MRIFIPRSCCVGESSLEIWAIKNQLRHSVARGKRWLCLWSYLVSFQQWNSCLYSRLHPLKYISSFSNLMSTILRVVTSCASYMCVIAGPTLTIVFIDHNQIRELFANVLYAGEKSKNLLMLTYGGGVWARRRVKSKTQDKTTENEKREIFKWISICEWRNEPHLKYFYF